MSFTFDPATDVLVFVADLLPASVLILACASSRKVASANHLSFQAIVHLWVARFLHFMCAHACGGSIRNTMLNTWTDFVGLVAGVIFFYDFYRQYQMAYQFDEDKFILRGWAKYIVPFLGAAVVSLYWMQSQDVEFGADGFFFQYIVTYGEALNCSCVMFMALICPAEDDCVVVGENKNWLANVKHAHLVTLMFLTKVARVLMWFHLMEVMELTWYSCIVMQVCCDALAMGVVAVTGVKCISEVSLELAEKSSTSCAPDFAFIETSSRVIELTQQGRRVVKGHLLSGVQAVRQTFGIRDILFVIVTAIVLTKY